MAQEDNNAEQWDEFFSGLEKAGDGLISEASGDVATAMAKHQDTLMRLPNVLAVAPGYRLRAGKALDEECLVVYVTEKVPKANLDPGDVIPNVVDGVPVDVVAVGEIRPQ